MTVFKVRKSLLFALLFFVAPVGGLIVYAELQPDPGYSVMLSMKDGRAVVGDCKVAPAYDRYLAELNEANKPNNVVCEFSGQLTTMSKGIECHILHGPTQGFIYWAENMAECEKIKSKIGTP
jgi:hypothetical protein